MFNPRLARVLPSTEHHSSVPGHHLTVEGLTQRFAAPPRWQPEIDRELPGGEKPLVPAAVLIGIVSSVEPTVLLTVRSNRLPVHAGQVAFPGGKWDAQDASASAVALREAHEEIGLPPASVSVLGCLPDYVTGTGFCVTPVVGLVAEGVDFMVSPDEVELVFEVPLRFLMDPRNHVRQEAEHNGLMRQWYAMPYVRQGETFYIWGATAGMLRNLYHFLAA